MRHSEKESLLENYYKTIADVGLEFELQHAESIHTVVLSQMSEFMPESQKELLVPEPLMPRCGVRDVDRREVVQVSAICFCPSMGSLRISVLLILLPPDCDGVLVMFLCSSSGIHCFPMILLPLSFAVLLAP